MMLPFLKKKKSVEEIAHAWVKKSLPSAYDFYRNENGHSRTPLILDEKSLREQGAGMCLFYLAEFLPAEKSGNQAKMGRAFSQLKKDFRNTRTNPQQSYDSWKALMDALTLHDHLPRVELATRMAWERLLPDRKYIEQTPLRAYAYFLELQLKDVENYKII